MLWSKMIGVAFAIVTCLAPGTACAADTIIALPTGWSARSEFFAARGENLALALKPQGGGHAIRLFQYHGGATVSTDFTGPIYGLEFTPDSQAVLVHFAEPVAGVFEGTPKTSLVSSTGTVLWTLPGHVTLSLTGASVFEWVSGHDAPRRLETYDLQGSFRRRFKFERQPLSGFSLASGDSIVTVVGFTLMRFDVVNGNITESWRTNLTSADYEPLKLDAFDSDTLLLRQAYGHFKLVSTSGLVAYSFNPCDSLSSLSYGKSWQEYASYKVYPTPDQNRLALFNGTADGIIINRQTGAASAVAIDVAPPSGYTRSPIISDFKLLFVGVTDVRLRSLPPLP